jgi:ASPM-SPD-2-Hydin domain-containing protein
MRRMLPLGLLLFCLLLPLSAFAQLQVFVLNGTTLTPVGSFLSVGPAAPGDTIQIQFRVQNPGSQSVPLTVSLSSDGAFTIQCNASPYVPPLEESAFCVDFSPTAAGSYSASLKVNAMVILLTGNAVAGASLTLSGSTTPLVYGATIDFGSAAVGATQTKTFALSNPNNGDLTVNSVIVSGSGFGGPTGQVFPAQIGPGQSITFEVAFKPQAGTPYQGALTVDNRAFTLTGQGLVPPLPDASIVFASSVGASAQQNSLTIPLASASGRSGTGTLTLAFQPSVAGVTDDAAIQFLSGPFRIATVSIATGATSATIGGLPSMAFQTGTTAGIITFTLTLENNSPQQTSLTIPPAPVILDTATAVGLLGSLNVAFSGFDNTYSASQLAFTFYDLTGKALPQGVINADAGSAFQQYFATTQAGGSFALLATFPVTGNGAEIGFVTVQIANSIGTTTTQQITIAPPPAPPTVSQI